VECRVDLGGQPRPSKPETGLQLGAGTRWVVDDAFSELWTARQIRYEVDLARPSPPPPQLPTSGGWRRPRPVPQLGLAATAAPGRRQYLVPGC
jgi:hypothetical protein